MLYFIIFQNKDLLSNGNARTQPGHTLTLTHGKRRLYYPLLETARCVCGRSSLSLSLHTRVGSAVIILNDRIQRDGERTVT